MPDKSLEEEIENRSLGGGDASETKAESILAPSDSEALPGITVKEVLRLALPAVAQLMLQSLVFLADRAMLGRYSTDSLASMQVSATFYWCLYSTVSAFSVGAIALVGRAVGARERRLAGAAVRGSLLLALGVGLAIALGSTLGLKPFLALFTFGSTGVLADADAYLDILLLAMPLQLLAIIAASVLQASGNTKIPFIVAIFANSINIFINYWLIFGNFGAPALGVKGAAIGSVVAIAINATILVAVLWRGTKALTLLGRGGELAALGRILRVSLPAFSEMLFRSICYMVYTAIIGSIGSVAMAAYEAIIGIEIVFVEMADGFGIAAAAIVSQQLGAHRPSSAAAGTRVAIAIAAASLSIGSLLFFLIPDKLLGIFSRDPEIIATGVPGLYVAAIAQPFMAVALVLTRALRGAGDTRSALYISVFGLFFIRILGTYFFSLVLDLGLIGVWLGSTLDWIVRSGLLLLVFWRGKWQTIRV
ncbi:MAG: MATE family efflux transporter [Oscillatoria sp. SIO1A7]|nr:MATE family efflux transporter [Oscillatoria sp. SIO1A7]